MTTKRRSYAARLGVLVVVLTLMSTCLLGGTMAKYTTEVTGTGSATVAKWSFKANGQTATMAEVDLANTAYTNVTSGKIAPGTEGSFDIEIDASGSEVALDYVIEFSSLSNMPANLKFYSDDKHSAEINDLASYTGLNGEIALNEVDNKVTKTVYWAWAAGDATTASADTTDGEAAKKETFAITVTGTQQTPTAAATS